MITTSAKKKMTLVFLSVSQHQKLRQLWPSATWSSSHPWNWQRPVPSAPTMQMRSVFTTALWGRYKSFHRRTRVYRHFFFFLQKQWICLTTLQIQKGSHLSHVANPTHHPQLLTASFEAPYHSVMLWFTLSPQGWTFETLTVFGMSYFSSIHISTAHILDL